METAAVDLSKLRDVEKNEVVKKIEYIKSVKKVNNINTTDTSELVKKTDHKWTSDNFRATLKQVNLASKNDIADFVKKPDFNDKMKNLNKIKHIEVKTKLDDLQSMTKIIETHYIFIKKSTKRH